jgi:hypothetical protein
MCHLGAALSKRDVDMSEFGAVCGDLGVEIAKHGAAFGHLYAMSLDICDTIVT